MSLYNIYTTPKGYYYEIVNNKKIRITKKIYDIKMDKNKSSFGYTLTKSSNLLQLNKQSKNTPNQLLYNPSTSKLNDFSKQQYKSLILCSCS